MKPQPGIKEVVKQLERYWNENPAAADTADGISQWWLSGVPHAMVRQALDALVKAGVVETHETAAGVRYCLRKR